MGLDRASRRKKRVARVEQPSRERVARSATVLACFSRKAAHAGLNQSQLRNVEARIGLYALSCIGIGCLSAVFGVIAFLCLVGAEFMLISRRTSRRTELFERDYPAFLVSLAASIRTGLDPLSAMASTADLFTPGTPLQFELCLFSEKLALGASEEEAIDSFASSIKHPDISLFRTAFILARREGSSIAGCLQRLAKVTRQRQSFRRKIRGAVAMQRLSAFGIAGCTVFIVTIQATTNPDGMREAWAHPMGSVLLVGGVLLVLLGLGWMMWIARRAE